jgi:uncharacterized membrane protein
MKFSPRGYKIAVTLLVLQCLLLAATFYLTTNSIQTPDIVTFIGRFHPMMLHLPIGIVAILFLMRLGGFLMPTLKAREPINFIWVFANCSTTVTALFGLLLAAKSDYDAHMLSDHRLSGTGLAVSLIIASFFRLQYLKNESNVSQKAYRFFFIITIALMPLTGHNGGSLTHGTQYLFEYLPEPLRFLAGPEEEKPSSITASAENATIMKIFKDKCYRCHGPEKQKGDYRLDIRSDALRGGDSETEAIIAGDALQSYLFELITLPSDDDDIMPPEGKGTLSAEEIMNIKHWIDNGAHYEK